MKKIISFIFSLALSFPVIADVDYDEIAESYVKLVLALGQHDSSYVDAYYGPDKWKKEANKKQRTLKSITKDAENLVKKLSDEPKDEMRILRHIYLQKQLKALGAKARMLSGEVIYDFDQESLALYDTQAPHHDLSYFQDILSQLEKLLPGKTTLPERVNNFRSQFVIPEEKLSTVFEAAIEECRKRTKAFLSLPKNENFKLEYVRDKPWSGYNWYKGKAFSLIQMNVELPIQISRAVDLGCHEGYPGHHTYNALLEENLYNKRGWVENSVYPLYSPQSLIAEGSANYGIDLAFPGDEKVKFEKEVLFPLAGLDPNLAEKYGRVSELISELSYASNEVARRYINGDIGGTAASILLQKYALVSPAKSRQRIKFYDAYGAYVINYNWGKDLVKKWVESGPDQTPSGRWKRFSKLLTSPRLPSTLD